MRLLILLSTFLLSTVHPVPPTEKRVVKNQNATEKATLVPSKNSGELATAIHFDLDYLMNGAWKIMSIVADKPCDVNGDGYETTNIYAETPSCALDDVMKVCANHTLSFERHMRCVSTERALETYKWTLAKDGTFIIHDGSIQAKMILKSVSATRLILLIPMEEDGEVFHFRVTYGQTVKALPGKALKN